MINANCLRSVVAAVALASRVGLAHAELPFGAPLPYLWHVPGAKTDGLTDHASEIDPSDYHFNGKGVVGEAMDGDFSTNSVALELLELAACAHGVPSVAQTGDTYSWSCGPWSIKRTITRDQTGQTSGFTVGVSAVETDGDTIADAWSACVRRPGWRVVQRSDVSIECRRGDGAAQRVMTYSVLPVTEPVRVLGMPIGKRRAHQINLVVIDKN
ncbi:hypothetical protein [Burkholderia multivorans]|uniref:hypothetical protein n=1 Tax=Burkholderia multivorans TaxID=87883 RepID=UPI00158ACE8D|nr:hypothetical protein [Burkholderia multivorans]